MSTGGRVIISLLAGCVLGWWLLAGFCSIPGLKQSNACGHNAYVWAPLFVPAVIGVCWVVLGIIVKNRRKRVRTEHSESL